MRLFLVYCFLSILSCKERNKTFSYLPEKSDNPLWVAELGEKLNFLEIKTKYPISGTPSIIKSRDYFYLFEQGMVTTLYQANLKGEILRSLEFEEDGRLPSGQISQIILKDNKIGVVLSEDKVIWLNEDMIEIGEQRFPVKAKFHFPIGEQFLAYSNQPNINASDIYLYDTLIREEYLPVDKEAYNFYNETTSQFSTWREGVLFSKAFNDTIYFWDRNRLEPLLHIDFGSRKFPREELYGVEDARDFAKIINSRKHNFLIGEVFGLDQDKILFRLIEADGKNLGLVDVIEEKLTLYPAIIDNSVSGLNLGFPQFSENGVLYFGISGEEVEEEFSRLPNSFKHNLSENYPESYFIFVLKVKDE